jgi:hypothetical protein
MSEPSSRRFVHISITFVDIVTDDPGSKPDQKSARRRDGQNYIRKNKLKIYDLEQKEYQGGTIYWYIGRE